MNFIAILAALGLEQWRAFRWRGALERAFVRYARALERKLNGGTARQGAIAMVAARCLPALPGADRPQVVLAGVEAHAALLQTALELTEEGKEVYVVADAVASRDDADRDLALARIRQEGVRIVSREMVVYEWLGDAQSPLWKDVSREFLR